MNHTRDLTAEVIVDATPLFSVEQAIFGQFIEHFHREIYGGIYDLGSPLSDHQGFRRDVLDALRELGVPVVRWPGGSFASGYHWKDGIGRDREAVFDRAWRVPESNRFGTDEFLRWTSDLGAEAYICTNAGTGSLDEMTDWVEYCNGSAGTRWADRRVANGRSEPYRVPYWSVGNENYEEWELGAEDPAVWARKVAEMAKAIRRVDPTVTLLAASSGFPTWTQPMLEVAGKYLDHISVHRYWDDLADDNKPADYVTCMSKTLEPDRTMQQLHSLLDVARMPHLGIVFDEWNLRGWHHPAGNSADVIAARDLNDDNSTYTMADAVFSACFLNACVRHADRVKMANFAPAINSRGALYVHPEGVVKRTTFHVFAMLRSLLPGHTLPTTTYSSAMDANGSTIPTVDVAGTLDPATRRIALSIVNKSPHQQAELQIHVDNRLLSGRCNATILSGDSPDAFNSVDRPHRVVPERTTLEVAAGRVTLPPHSVTILEVPAERPHQSRPPWMSTTGGGWLRIAAGAAGP
ncbi:alpha-L-arabinofuranosidase C-terminal domain-containing protein [Microbacterium sp. NPDC058062]|uniref:alpha-L-arabinofuranosidase C-terminal domain-containing protein n=1 Tax=Microbacterium sp. NPDC058062 TaxID=3346320 RepID=UPI0036D8DD29